MSSISYFWGSRGLNHASHQIHSELNNYEHYQSFILFLLIFWQKKYQQNQCYIQNFALIHICFNDFQGFFWGGFQATVCHTEENKSKSSQQQQVVALYYIVYIIMLTQRNNKKESYIASQGGRSEKKILIASLKTEQDMTCNIVVN